MDEFLFYLLVVIGVAYAIRCYWKQWHGADKSRPDAASQDRRECAWEEGCDDL